MKKLLSLFLCAVLLCMMIPGCERAPDIDSIEDITDEPLRLCVDFGDTSPMSSRDQIIQSFTEMMQMYYETGQGGPEKFEMEIVPASGSERAITLTRIRTEVMSGGGPDVFVSVCPDLTTSASGLFPFVEKAMAAGYFLPLDDYIEKKSQFTEWDKLEASIMEAGKYDGKQMVLPMAFDLPVTYYHLNEAEGFDGTTTWNDMITSDDPTLAAAMKPVFDGDSRNQDLWFPSVFREYIDYETDDLLITEEELLQRVKEAREAQRAKRYLKAPKHYSSTAAHLNFGVGLSAINHRDMNGFSSESNVTMVPVYNTGGGTTAFVRAYCAINRNTLQPSNAFFVADYLLSEGVQGSSGIYSAWITTSMASNTNFVKRIALWRQSEEITRILEQISCVRFWTPLDAELSDLMFNAVYKATNDEEVEEYVSEAYTKMQMMLAES